MVNNQFNFGLFFETGLIALLIYCPGLNAGFGIRALACPHFAVPAMCWIATIFFYDELRKMFIRQGMIKQTGKRVRFDGWVARNTYY